MFQKKKEIKKLERKNRNLQEENERLKRCVDSWEKECNRIKKELEYEQIKSYKNKQVILNIKKMYKSSYGNITALIQFRKNVKKELDNVKGID